jgi:hypothetical protein
MYNYKMTKVDWLAAGVWLIPSSKDRSTNKYGGVQLIHPAMRSKGLRRLEF